MRVPAALIYAFLVGLVGVSWHNPPVGAALMMALAGATAVFMALQGVHPVFGYFFIGSVVIDPENEP